MRLRVALNGTDKNPFHQFGLTQNPFPQDVPYEYVNACLRLQSLGGDPIQSYEHISFVLKGFSTEFITLCQRLYQPGKYVEFTVEYKSFEG